MHTIERQIEMFLQKTHHQYRRTVDWQLADAYEAAGMDPAARMADRFERLCREEQPVIMPGEQICFLRTVTNQPEVLSNQEREELSRRYYKHEFQRWNNLCPNYADAIAKGLLKKREEADENGQRMVDAIVELSDRYLAEAKRQGREDLAEILTQVPRYPARNFREALQFFRILHFALWVEGDYHNTVGRFDQYMLPYLQQDLQNGTHTRESALDLLRHFFLSFNKDSDLYPGVQQGDNGQSMMLGGTDLQGNEMFNLLSELCLEASYENRMIDPKINLRVSSKTPQEIFTKATKLTRAGLGFPQYSNDDVVIPALERLGYEPEDAHNYTVAACWEFIIPNVGVEIPNISALSFPMIVDRVLHRDLTACKSYEEFQNAVCREIGAETAVMCERINGLWITPAPYLNLLMDGALEKGGKYNNFGFHGTGVATAADSLAAIRKYVFEEGVVTAQEMIDAVDSNFAETPELLHQLRFEAPKLGNNDDYVDSIAVELLDAFGHSLEGKKNCRGGIFRAGTGSAMFYLKHANEIGASPDGRRKGEPFGTNFSVSLFAKVKGPVSVIASMTKPHFENACNGGPLTLEFHQSVFDDPDGVEKVGLLVKSFVDRGGHQLQLNTVDRERLLDAQKHPERHRSLVVRIWGWSAYFVELDKEYQDHVLARQAYRL